MRPPVLSTPAHLEADDRAATVSAAKSLTLTGLYNVLQALREGRPLTAKEKLIHSAGLVGVLKELHDALDAAVLQAYGWADLTPLDQSLDELLTRLVALNARRAVEEAAGTVRWLRPDFQNPAKELSKPVLPAPVQQELEVDFPQTTQVQIAGTTTAASSVTALGAWLPWPTTLPDQVRVVAQVLSQASGPLTLAAIEARFKGRGGWKKSLPILLQTLEALGRAQQCVIDKQLAWRGGELIRRDEPVKVEEMEASMPG